MFVAVAGNVGVGKSTLTAMLAARYALEPVYEAVADNPYLADFYGDMSRWAFHSQTFFLGERLRQHLHVVQHGERIVQDRTIFEDAEVFARHLYQQGILSHRDHSSYRRLYDAIASTLRTPDLLVYLRARVDTLQARIARRGRDYESNVSDAYLGRLNVLYDDFVAGYRASPVVTLDTDDVDVVSNADDRAATFEILERHGLDLPLVRSGEAAWIATS